MGFYRDTTCPRKIIKHKIFYVFYSLSASLRTTFVFTWECYSGKTLTSVINIFVKLIKISDTSIKKIWINWVISEVIGEFTVILPVATAAATTTVSATTNNFAENQMKLIVCRLVVFGKYVYLLSFAWKLYAEL